MCHRLLGRTSEISLRAGPHQDFKVFFQQHNFEGELNKSASFQPDVAGVISTRRQNSLAQVMLRMQLSETFQIILLCCPQY